jgi:hypothetical protein
MPLQSSRLLRLQRSFIEGVYTPSAEPMMGKFKYKEKKTGKIIISDYPLNTIDYELLQVLIKQK